VLTARHLFYSGNESFRAKIHVTFALDPLNEYPASFYVDFPNLDLAVLKLSVDKDWPEKLKTLNDLAPLKVRPADESLKLREDIFLVGGKFQDWQVPKDSVSGLRDSSDRKDRFRFTGTGVHDGFSGSAILDSNDRLVAVHLGGVPSDDGYGRAQRITEALDILSDNNVPINKLDTTLSSAKTAPTPARPTNPVAGDLRKNTKDGLTYVWIPPGDFQMGCSPGDGECYSDEKPPHKVTISKGFWLSQTTITLRAWKKYRSATGAAALPTSDSVGRANLNEAGNNDSMPIVAVTWSEAKSYCEWACGEGGKYPEPLCDVGGHCLVRR
jgi:hypothetical protein